MSWAPRVSTLGWYLVPAPELPASLCVVQRRLIIGKCNAESIIELAV